MTLLTPAWWRENYRRYSFEQSREHRFTPVIGETVFTGRELQAFYRSGVAEAFRRSRPDVVLMMEESFTLFGLQIAHAASRFAPKAPLIFYNNNVVSYDLPGFRLSALYRSIGARVTPICDLGLCVNAQAVEVLRHSGYGVPALELFYGIDDELFHPDVDGADARALRQRFGLSPETRVVICFGRQLEAKGYQDVVAALAEVQRNDPKIPLHLIIVGSGPFEREIADRAAARLLPQSYTLLPTVPFEEVPALMRGADAHVLPSHAEINEQFGRVNAEAMLSGTLAIASRSGGVPGVIGTGGILFEPRDVAALAAILESIVRNPQRYTATVEEGRRRAMARYSVGRFVRGSARIVRRLAAGEKPEEIVRSFPEEP